MRNRPTPWFGRPISIVLNYSLTYANPGNPAKTPPQPWESTPKYVYMKQPQIPSPSRHQAGIHPVQQSGRDVVRLAKMHVAFSGNPYSTQVPRISFVPGESHLRGIRIHRPRGMVHYKYTNRHERRHNTKSTCRAGGVADPRGPRMEIKTARKPVASIDPTERWSSKPPITSRHRRGTAGVRGRATHTGRLPRRRLILRRGKWPLHVRGHAWRSCSRCTSSTKRPTTL